MLFNSIEYLFFLPIMFILYWSLTKRLQLQNLLLLSGSYFFYGLWDYRFLSLIILSSTVDFVLGIKMGNTDSKRKKKILLFISLFVNLGFLFVFKYFNFFLDSFVNLSNNIGIEIANTTTLNIILPVGISFYTFQTLSYTIDIYRGSLKPSKNILSFFTYVAFFPQLVAGPIERAINLLPQIENRRIFDFNQARDGMRQILWGMFKKVVVADNCAMFVNFIFMDYQELSGIILIVGAVLFAFQIYCDFSGYSDIAIGTSKLLGIKLMQNFATPYFSRDIAEFWRRWHISLSTWFRDYLYIPLGGSRVSKIKKVRNIFTIFLVSGFWHGANWTFVMWGFIHALCYMPQMVSNTNRRFLGTVSMNRIFPNLKELYLILKTFGIVTLAWVFFRADTINDAFLYLFRIVDFSGNNLTYVLASTKQSIQDFSLLIGYIVMLLCVEWINRNEEFCFSRLPANKPLRTVLYLIVTLLVIQYFFGESSFIYFQF